MLIDEGRTSSIPVEDKEGVGASVGLGVSVAVGVGAVVGVEWASCPAPTVPQPTSPPASNRLIDSVKEKATIRRSDGTAWETETTLFIFKCRMLVLLATCHLATKQAVPENVRCR